MKLLLIYYHVRSDTFHVNGNVTPHAFKIKSFVLHISNILVLFKNVDHISIKNHIHAKKISAKQFFLELVNDIQLLQFMGKVSSG